MAVGSEYYDIVRMDELDVAFAYGEERTGTVSRRLKTMLIPPGQDSRRGGFGYVCKAFNTQGEVFALKRLVNLSPAYIAAFENEYNNYLMLSQIPNFPRAYGYGISDGKPAIIMEWVAGKSLAQVYGSIVERSVKERGVYTLLEIGRSIAIALSRAEDAGIKIVHRDISPANIMFNSATEPRNGVVRSRRDRDLFKIVDLSSLIIIDGAGSLRISPRLSHHGTPEYAAPEMLDEHLPESARMSPSIDVYSLCSILYELYTGHTPFRLSDHPGTSASVLKRTCMPDVPELKRPEDALLVRTIIDGLSADPENRPDMHYLRHLFICYRAPHLVRGFDDELTEGEKAYEQLNK